jgi:hypothetical protein
MTKIRTTTKEYSDAELLRWYDLIMECRAITRRSKNLRNKGTAAFCRRKGVDPTRYQWFHFRFFFKEESNPEAHIREIEIANSYRESGLEKREFCKLNNYPAGKLSAADMHLTYRERLDKLVANRPTGLPLDIIEIKEIVQEDEPLSFHQVPTFATPFKPILEPASIDQSPKEIELITAGVRVFVSHGIGHEKLIKIFEFLEGL